MLGEPSPQKIRLIFYRTSTGSEPVREWLKGLNFTNFNIPGWQITLQDTSTFIQIPGGLGMPVSFKLIVDQQAQIAYALYNFGSGTQTSATLSLVGHTELSQADAVSVFGDYRFGTLQGQFDNIVVSQTTTPEPSSLWMAGFSLAGLLTLNRFTSRKVTE